MRFELENVKGIMQKAANSAGIYHENIAHVRRTCRPEVVAAETEIHAKQLKEAMEKARTEAFAQLDALADTIKRNSRLDIQNYRADIVEFFRTMKPGAEDLEAMAKQFEGNETMLQFFHRYAEENAMIAELPMCFSDKQKFVQQIRNDLSYAFDCAGEPFHVEKNRNGHVMLQHWGDNFDSVFADRISAIGDF